SCVRFKTLDDLPLPLIGETIKSLPVSELVEAVRQATSGRKPRAKTRRTKTTATKTRSRRGAKKR
ncbi:MAG: hypothetical protein QGG89_14905, partial [Vicinamibacterales bacterium]|nr:hypothetical protein [Vicinamibacterales bacterium]